MAIAAYPRRIKNNYWRKPPPNPNAMPKPDTILALYVGINKVGDKTVVRLFDRLRKVQICHGDLLFSRHRRSGNYPLVVII